MSKKKKNIIDVPEALELISAYGLEGRIINFYQIRVKYEESRTFYDWYHTTGTLVKAKDEYFHKDKKFTEPESLAVYLQEQFLNELSYGKK